MKTDTCFICSAVFAIDDVEDQNICFECSAKIFNDFMAFIEVENTIHYMDDGIPPALDATEAIRTGRSFLFERDLIKRYFHPEFELLDDPVVFIEKTVGDQLQLIEDKIKDTMESLDEHPTMQ